MLRTGPNGTAKWYNWCSVVHGETPRNSFLGNSASMVLLVLLLEHEEAFVVSILLAEDMVAKKDAMQNTVRRKKCAPVCPAP